MARLDPPDSCAVCGADLPEDPPDVTLPTGVAPRMTPLAKPGIRRVAFCCARHRRDWLDSHRGTWPDSIESPDNEE